MTGQRFPLHVLPELPARIDRLSDLAGNLWFSWHRPTRKLFDMLDRQLWWKTGRNPRVFLRCVDQGILEMAAQNDTFLAAYRRVLAEYDAYMEQGAEAYAPAGLERDDLVAYFCAEFGYHESFPIYSGGLGILAGDHCKTASDLRLPFVAVGLLYRQGYFNQKIDEHGQQHAEPALIDANGAPVRPVHTEQGEELLVELQFPGRVLRLRVWQADVGRIPVLLLDSDVPGNDSADREITRQLYGGDRELRLQQELVLGVGGVRALRAAGFAPRVWHINEGHAAFMIIERVREHLASGKEFPAALEAVAANTVFTTHTPVAAGHDVFDEQMTTGYLQPLLGNQALPVELLLRLGPDTGGHGGFNMTRLGLSGSRHVNGVSRVHRHVTARLCGPAWPEVPPDENPVGYVTNGVHVPTFMRTEWADLLDQQLGPSWRWQMMDRGLIEQVMDIPDGRFWYVRQQIKSRMLAGLRARLEHQYSRNQLSEAHAHRLLRYLDPGQPDALVVGFARRFATYKRANLLLNDLGWLRDIVGNGQRPVVFVFAGKAHPQDIPAQKVLQEVQRVASMPEFSGRLLLVEGYDMGLGRLLTAGVDVWLNTPVYPLEASGTSGMKAAINGTLNLSVLDGWWAEAYDGSNGWAIPPSPHNQAAEERDIHDSRTLYEILQDEVIPLYYERDERLGYSPDWVSLCKRSMASVLPYFNMQRVVHDYACRFYGPAARRGALLEAEGLAAASRLADWKARVAAHWAGVTLRTASTSPGSPGSGSPVTLEVEACLGELSPADVRVECIVARELCSELSVPVRQFADRGSSEYGVRWLDGVPCFVAAFTPVEGGSGGFSRFRLSLEPPWSGMLSYRVRIVPHHELLAHPYEMGLMCWL
ncbi:MAG: alpha-glucan family phosphorylase [Chromatiales bacterium]|nr:alpha-glucan family phosphorylase [Chromatiales bacterium]